MYLSAAKRIEDWLLHSNVYIESGTEAGAVAGWLTECGAPSFAYPEITGYYLTCMAFTGRFSPGAMPLARERAGKSADWLARRALNSGPPLTRHYLHPQIENDWRNAAVFSFDIAMVLRGVAHAYWFSPPPRRLLDQYVAYLLDLCTPEDVLRPLKLRDGHHADELPSTWSTADGVHHVKTAAAILSLPESSRPARLSAAARNLLGCWVGEPWQHLQAMPLHPLFYYLEGLLLLSAAESDPDRLDEVADVYAAVMQQQDAAGFLPPAPGPEPVLLRSDVIAQALRIGSVLNALGRLQGEGWDARLEGLAKALLSFVGTDGAVSQYPLRSRSARQWNAWCSMFAYQAFVFYGTLVERKVATMPGYYLELLV